MNEDKIKTINQLIADINLRLCEIRRIAGDPVSNFLDLSDTPGAYVGHGTKVVSVKAAEDGLEFIVGGAGGGGVTWAYVDGQWYGQDLIPNYNLGSLIYVGIDTLWAYPILIGQAQSFDKICACVYTAVGGSNFRCGIYECNKTTGYPSDLVIDSGALSGASTGCKEANITATLDPELYYLAILADGNIRFRGTRRGYIRNFLGRSVCDAVYPDTAWSVSQAYGALPDPFPGGASLSQELYLIGIMIRAV